MYKLLHLYMCPFSSLLLEGYTLRDLHQFSGFHLLD